MQLEKRNNLAINPPVGGSPTKATAQITLITPNNGNFIPKPDTSLNNKFSPFFFMKLDKKKGQNIHDRINNDVIFKYENKYP